MIEFFKSNPLLFVTIIAVIVFLLLFLVIKYSRTQPKKVEKMSSKEPEKKETTTSGEASKSEVSEKTSKDKPAEKTEETAKGPAETIKQKKKLKKAKRSVEQVFKRDVKTGQTVVNDEVKSSISEEELLSKMGFVTSTKKVSKLVKLPEDSKIATEVFIEHPPEEEMIPEEVKHDKDNCKYFNKSRRLSKFVEENNFDEMFAEHLSEHYLNIDISKHLDVSEETTNKLYERASKTLANSDVRIISDEDSDKISIRGNKELTESFKEDKRREIFADLIESRSEKQDTSEILTIDDNSLDDDIKLDSKTVLVADALLNRKGRKRK